MRFTHNGKTYAIDFQRERKMVPVGITPKRYGNLGHNAEVLYAPSNRPYTTVRLLQVDEEKPFKDWYVYRTATVGCWHREKQFSLERGRLHALRLVTLTLDKEMRTKMWEVYTRRRGNRKV